jgi:hypothetical protein
VGLSNGVSLRGFQENPISTFILLPLELGKSKMRKRNRENSGKVLKGRERKFCLERGDTEDPSQIAFQKGYIIFAL